MTYHGRFIPKYPQKYKGDPTNIIYRSSWEQRVMRQLDLHPQVEWWASEELPIKYISPIDQRVHRYFPDFIVKVRRADGTAATHVLEVKPAAQTILRTPKRQTRKFLQEVKTFAVNRAKWKAADEFCQEHGWSFRIITEHDLGLK